MSIEKMAPQKRAVVVTPNDSTDLTYWANALYIGTDGDVYLDTTGGDTNVPFLGLKSGTILPVEVTRVRATNTTVTSIVALRHR